MNAIPRYPEAKFTSAKEWHLYFVYNDEEFSNDMSALADKYRGLSNKNTKDINRGDSIFPDWFALTINNQWQVIKGEYSISDIDIAYYLQGLQNQGYINANSDENVGFVYIASDHPRIRVALNLFVTYKSYMRLWKEVQQVKSQLIEPTEPKKRKPPENPMLVYAIFKARKTSTFKQIFDKYKTGALPSYKGPNTQYITKEDLKTYYNRHKPD